MRKNLLSLTFVAGLSTLPAIGHAQAVDGAFVKGNIGSASLDRGPFDDSDTSYGINLGYRWAVSPGTLIGFEAGYVSLGKYAYPTSATFVEIAQPGEPPNDPTTYFGSVRTELSGWTIGANARFNLSPNWFIGGRAGFIRAKLDSRVRINLSDSVFRDDFNNDADGWYAGASFGYDFSKNLSVGLNYDYYSAKDHGFKINPDVVSVSGEYRF